MDDCFVATLTMPGRIESVRPVATFFVDLARRLCVPQAAQSLFENAIVEALNNAVEHSDPGRLTCELESRGSELCIRVLSEGARAPVALAAGAELAVLTADAWQQVPDSGYGLSLMRAVFPDIRPIARDGVHGIEMTLTY
jgi:anti-sigma regulatory factor (Ser/Thr protein kinase)